MLRFLSIKHLAVIDAAEVEFDPGLNVLTGETGAGKSILVEAISLLLGGRASGDLVRTGEDTASVDAIFENAGSELLIRREVTSQGRSRAFVDGALTTAGALKDLSGPLIELHGQHEHYTLLDPATQLEVLDAFGGLAPLADPTAAAYDELESAVDALQQAKTDAIDRGARQELAAFQLAELERAALVPGEDVELAATKQVLASAERVERLCAESYASLYDGDGAALADLGAVWRRVAELAALDPKFEPYLEARDGIKSQLEDLAHFLRRYWDGIEASPARLQQVEERLALVERLKRKHGPTLRDVIEKRDSLRRVLAECEDHDERIAELERTCASARDRYVAAAGTLAEARRRVAADFVRQLEHLLGELAMEETRLEVRFADPLGPHEWTAAGIDRVEIVVSPNPGEDLRPLARIVSGGELSRIMLAIKTLTAVSRRGFTTADGRQGGRSAPGLVFDEVDAGIGGRVADVVGTKLRALGSAFQVLCITHLPQIAAAADTHFRIEKRVEGGRTRTTIWRLDDQGRVDEIARMLAGVDVTDQIRTSAREMLAARQAGRRPAAANLKSESKAKGESERASAEQQ